MAVPAASDGEGVDPVQIAAVEERKGIGVEAGTGDEGAVIGLVGVVHAGTV
jgi:hypothetical protein